MWIMHHDFLFLNYLWFTSQETEIRRNDKSFVCPSFKRNSQFFSITSIISSLSLSNPPVNHIKKIHSTFTYDWNEAIPDTLEKDAFGRCFSGSGPTERPLGYIFNHCAWVCFATLTILLFVCHLDDS